jgi:anti-sigma-K factor RskA
MTDTPDDTLPPPYNWGRQRWRLATIVCLVLLAIATATIFSMQEQFKAQIEHLQTKMKSLPQVKYVAVLLDDKHEPAQLLTFDPQDGYLQVQRLNEVNEGQEDSMQLWALDDSGRPLSLGVLPAKLKTAQVQVSDKILAQAVGLAISVESRGGVAPDQAPRLPYLYTGKLIKKAL